MSHKPAPLVSENAVRAAPGLANREMTVYTSRKPATVPTSHRVGLLMLFYLTPRGPSNALSASATDDCSEASPHELLSPSLSRKYVSQPDPPGNLLRSEEHTSELQSRLHLVCRLLLEKKKHQ